MSRVLVECMQGIGDQLYSRPFVHLLAQNHEVHLRTKLPELYSDVPNAKFTTDGEFDRVINWNFGRIELRAHGIVPHLERAFGFDLSSLEFSLPDWAETNELIDQLVQPNQKKIAVIRPVTLQKDRIGSTRAPLPNYISWCARMLRDAGYFVVSIADLSSGVETLVEDPPPADLYLHNNELGLKGTLNLLKRAYVVVGGSGFIIPATVSAGTNLFVVFGGRGEYDNPHKVFDLRMNLKKIGWVLPDNFCRCNKWTHDCDKTIKNLDDKFFDFMGRIQ